MDLAVNVQFIVDVLNKSIDGFDNDDSDFKIIHEIALQRSHLKQDINDILDAVLSLTINYINYQ